jgi:hypothetical protein
MAEKMTQFYVPGIPYTRYDLRNANERITQVRAYIERERAKLGKLPADSGEAIGSRGVLSALERTLRHFLDYRNWIEEQLNVAELNPA